MTAADCKRQGLARACLRAAMHRLGARDHAQPSLVVTRANDPAMRLYESLGFRLGR